MIKDRNSRNGIVRICSKVTGVKQRDLISFVTNKSSVKHQVFWLLMDAYLEVIFSVGIKASLPTCKTNRYSIDSFPLQSDCKCSVASFLNHCHCRSIFFFFLIWFFIIFISDLIFKSRKCNILMHLLEAYRQAFCEILDTGMGFSYHQSYIYIQCSWPKLWVVLKSVDSVWIHFLPRKRSLHLYSLTFLPSPSFSMCIAKFSQLPPFVVSWNKMKPSAGMYLLLLHVRAHAWNTNKTWVSRS